MSLLEFTVTFSFNSLSLVLSSQLLCHFTCNIILLLFSIIHSFYFKVCFSLIFVLWVLFIQKYFTFSSMLVLLSPCLLSFSIYFHFYFYFFFYFHFSCFFCYCRFWFHFVLIIMIILLIILNIFFLSL